MIQCKVVESEKSREEETLTGPWKPTEGFRVTCFIKQEVHLIILRADRQPVSCIRHRNKLLFREEASSKKSRNSLVTVIMLFYIFGKKPGE